MNLKELRLSNGLTQKECAKYLNISLRSYQIYENDLSENKSTKYMMIFNKLQSYKNDISPKTELHFYTNVISNNNLLFLYEKVKTYKKRDCFQSLERFIKESNCGKICAIYGLRRTGKTTLIFQMLEELPIDKTAYIKVQVTDSMANLTKDLYTLHNAGYKYVFIDEITLLSDFINTAAVLSDVFSMMDMKIIVSGTDSLGFMMASRDELYDRCIMVHTSFIPFREYYKLLNIHSIDKYIEYGGTLKMENMSFDDSDIHNDEVSFRNDESTRKYIDTAISRNIQNTLKNDHYGEYFNQLKELYNNGELTNVINRIVENINHDFLLKVIEDKFKSHDFGSAKDLLLQDAPSLRAYVLNDVDKDAILKKLKELIEIKEKEELKVNITQEIIEKVKQYLIMLELIVNCPTRYESGNYEEHYLFTQPGMRYAMVKALVYSLLQDTYFNTISEADKNYIINKILEDVKGKMLEEIVLLETFKVIPTSLEVFKFKFNGGGEFDMVIYNKIQNTCQLFEVKHSDKTNDKQTRFLLDEDKCNLIENKYGKITNKYVLYRGESKRIGTINYKNVEEFLISIKEFFSL